MRSMIEAATRAFVCGHPVAHSRSPLIHGFWLEQLEISGRYEAVDIHPDDFTGFIRGFPDRGFAGGNITIPHKEQAWKQVDLRDTAAEAIGAVNTVWIENGKICGGNTDAHGFSANLDALAPGWDDGETALVLGAGGAARAILFALAARGFSRIFLANRTLSRAEDLAGLFDGSTSALEWTKRHECLDRADLLVNTTSLGMGADAEPYMDLDLLPDHAIVTDIVYVPLETVLLRSARERGLCSVDGLGMLLHQAVPGFRHWFGATPRVSPELRARIVDNLETGR